jgi:hypothetical protein
VLSLSKDLRQRLETGATEPVEVTKPAEDSARSESNTRSRFGFSFAIMVAIRVTALRDPAEPGSLRSAVCNTELGQIKETADPGHGLPVSAITPIPEHTVLPS